MTPVVIAVDAMSGDHGPAVTVPASVNALARNPDLEIVLAGKADAIGAHLGEIPARMRVVDAREVVAMDEHPARALRGKKDSSMRRALELVRDGAAHACVSAGNTGALVAKSRYLLRTVAGIDMPAITVTIPARGAHTCMLDLGATADCTATQLQQFAIMGSVLAQCLFELEAPKVALLNIGAESIKGTSLIREADALIAAAGLNYIGYIEGDALMSGAANVIVTDGFTGNVALKTMEGVCARVLEGVREEFSRGALRRALSGLYAPVLNSLARRLDPRAYNGASLVGLRGTVIKSHGGADAVAFGHAIDIAVLEAHKGLPRQIARRLEGAASRQEAI